MLKFNFIVSFYLFSCSFSSEKPNEPAYSNDTINQTLVIDNQFDKTEFYDSIIKKGEDGISTTTGEQEKKYTEKIFTNTGAKIIPEKELKDTSDKIDEIISDVEIVQKTRELPSEVNDNPENNEIVEVADTEAGNDFTPADHQIFDKILQKYVREGHVDYQGLKNDKAELNKYLLSLEKNPPEKEWNRNEKLSFWINAYNAYTLKLIIDHYPVKSITDLHGGNPWDVKWININGQVLSLNGIENEIIRPQFKEPRIHFAVNCAAKSCPPLANTAFTPENIDDLLTIRTRNFINNPQYNTISKSKIEVSKIFDWYKEDFGDLISFINRYSDKEIKANASVSYKEYDWALNK